MAVKTLNIEIGDRLTKVCLSIPKGKSYQIKHCFMFQTPENAVADGAILAPDILAAELTEKLREHGLSDARSAVLTLTSGKVASREVMLPPIKESRIKGVITTNAADYFPIDLSGYHITYSLLERIDKGEHAGCRVLVYAAPLALLENYFKFADRAKLSVKAIDFSGNSQYQALRGLGAKEVTMYVNVDCTNSYVSFLQGGKLLLQRTFTFGGDEMILGYMGAAEMTNGEYVEALRACSSDAETFFASGHMTAADVSESLGRLVGSILRSSDYFNSNRWETQVEKVVLMGPCSRLVGLREMVASSTGLETTLLEELPGIASLSNAAESASFYISCIGSSVAPLDFMPEQFVADRRTARKKREKKETIAGGAAVCGVCLLTVLALSSMAMLNFMSARREKAALESRIAALEYTRTVYDTYLQYQRNTEALTALSDSVSSPNDELLAFIGELEQKMPTEIELLSAVCSRESVSMNITVPGYEEAAAVLVQLRDFESIEKLEIHSVTEELDEAGGRHATFTVNCIYKQSPAAAVESAADSGPAQG